MSLKIIISVFIFMNLVSCLDTANLLPLNKLNPPIGPGNPQEPIPDPGTGGIIANPNALFVANFEGSEGIFELKDLSITKHTALPTNSRLSSAVKIDNKIFYSLESMKFDVLGVSEVYELDIMTGISKKISQFHQNLSYGVSAVAKAGNDLYASVRSSSAGFELHKYANNQWQLIKDIEAGVVGSFPAMFVELNQNSYFLAYQAASGMELWSTKNGGSLHANIFAGKASSHVMPWFVKDSKLIVTAKNASTTSYDLYSVDDIGAFQKIVEPSGTANGGANPLSVYPYKNGAVANCHSDANGRELCVSSNLTGAWSVLNINTGTKPSNPKFFTLYQDQVYFQAEGSQGIELYRSNGQQVEIVKDIKAGVESSYPEGLMVINDKLYFSAYDQQGHGMFSCDGNTVVRITLQQKDLKYARSLLNPSR